MGRIGARFARVELRRRARAFVLGLLSGLPRANCWTIAEYTGESTPDGMQHLLARAAWDDEAVRDDLRGYVVEHLGDPEAVLIIDETGDVKRAPRRWGCSGSTPVPPGGSRTPRSGSIWSTPARVGTRSSTELESARARAGLLVRGYKGDLGNDLPRWESFGVESYAA